MTDFARAGRAGPGAARAAGTAPAATASDPTRSRSRRSSRLSQAGGAKGGAVMRRVPVEGGRAVPAEVVEAYPPSAAAVHARPRLPLLRPPAPGTAAPAEEQRFQQLQGYAGERRRDQPAEARGRDH